MAGGGYHQRIVSASGMVVTGDERREAQRARALGEEMFCIMNRKFHLFWGRVSCSSCIVVMCFFVVKALRDIFRRSFLVFSKGILVWILHCVNLVQSRVFNFSKKN